VYAVVRTGGKQYRVEPGKEFLVEKLEAAEKGAAVKLEDVLLWSDGEQLKVGKPQVTAIVHCLSMGEELGPKLRTVKYKRRKNFKRTYGHRQVYTRLRIENIEWKG